MIGDELLAEIKDKMRNGEPVAGLALQWLIWDTAHLPEITHGEAAE